MDKFSFEDLKKMADAVAEEKLLEQISGGTSNDCHDQPVTTPQTGSGTGICQ